MKLISNPLDCLLWALHEKSSVHFRTLTARATLFLSCGFVCSNTHTHTQTTNQSGGCRRSHARTKNISSSSAHSVFVAAAAAAAAAAKRVRANLRTSPTGFRSLARSLIHNHTNLQLALCRAGMCEDANALALMRVTRLPANLATHIYYYCAHNDASERALIATISFSCARSRSQQQSTKAELYVCVRVCDKTTQVGHACARRLATGRAANQRAHVQAII